MKNIIYLIIASAFILNACEEVIDVELNDAEPQLVIEGSIFPDEPAKVYISKTTDFFEPKSLNYLDGADIEISDNLGNSAQLIFNEAGYYTNESFTGVIGNTYTLKVDFEDETYIASSTIMEKNQIDTIEVEKIESPAQDTRMIVRIYLENDLGKDMYTRAKVVKNGENVDQYFISQTSIIPLQYAFEENDTLNIEILSLDEDTYYYYQTLADISGGGGALSSSTPANPVSNWDKEILGFFGAKNIEKRFLILQ